MNIQEYPLLKLFSEEIEILNHSQRSLSVIVLCGMFGELLVRELLDDETTFSFDTILNLALKKRLISLTQFIDLDWIRRCRNKYVHLSATKIVDDYELFIEYEDGTIDFANGIVKQDFSDESLLELTNLHVQEDAKKAYIAFTSLTNSL